MKLFVTGGRGFIGSHFVEKALSLGFKVVDFDKMTYASHKKLPWDSHKDYSFFERDISKIENIPDCDMVVNFAAESHVDNSIKNADPFISSNILGVYNLLEIIRLKFDYNRPKFFHISTDEVYGDAIHGSFKEEDNLNPSNPYSATKASAEMLLKSYARTYSLEYYMTRSSNNYGERQHPEKLIPKSIDCCLNNKKIPVHGTGEYIRDWLYVKDNIDAIFKIIECGKINETYNISSGNYLTNLNVIDEVLSWYSKDRSILNFVENRWGQDVRYSIDSSKIRNIGWKPKYSNGIYKWF